MHAVVAAKRTGGDNLYTELRWNMNGITYHRWGRHAGSPRIHAHSPMQWGTNSRIDVEEQSSKHTLSVFRDSSKTGRIMRGGSRLTVLGEIQTSYVPESSRNWGYWCKTGTWNSNTTREDTSRACRQHWVRQPLLIAMHGMRYIQILMRQEIQDMSGACDISKSGKPKSMRNVIQRMLHHH